MAPGKKREQGRRAPTSTLIGLGALLFSTLILTAAADAQTDATLPAFGGDGGSQFIARCPQGQLLNGFDLTVGNDVDAIRPLCAIAVTPSRTATVALYPVTFGSTRLPGSLEEQILGPLATVRLACPQESPIVIGLYVGWEGESTVIVNNVHLYCGIAGPTQSRNGYPTVVFDGKKGAYVGEGRQDCPNGLVAVGITGRSGKWLDAMGLICGAPRVTSLVVSPNLFEALKSGSAPEGIRPQRRVRDTGVETRPAPPICEAAKAARARNSPAAPGLEAKCVAETSVKPTPRVRGPDGTIAISTLTKCQAARQARARNSPAAPGLEAQCAANPDASEPASAGGAAPASEPDNTIFVRVRYRQELGYKEAADPFRNLGRTSCAAFTVAAAPSDDSGKQRNPIPVGVDLRMEEEGAYYVCNYVVSEVPLDRAISVRVGVYAADLRGAWEGGANTRPPGGERRTIVDETQTATLSLAQPRAGLTYEMVYAPIGKR